MPISIKAAGVVLFLALGTGGLTPVLPAPSATAASAARMYTATAVSQRPGQPERVGTIVKSGAKMRLEYTQNGKRVVQIILPTKGLMYILDPASKTYSLIRGKAVPEESVIGYKSPCPPTPNTRCEHVGDAISSGVRAERWLISSPGQTGGPVDILWDPARRHALSEVFPDGSKMLMRFRAMEKVAGRPTERWDVDIIRKGQPVVTGEWWFDPDLRVVVRQSIPGGETRRLDHLVVAPLDPAMFAPPAGWQQSEARSLTAPAAPKPAGN